MGKLAGRGLPSRLGAEPSRLRKTTSSEAERDRERDASYAWRSWYKTARWQRLRKKILARDGYVCQQTGVHLVGKHPAPNSPVVDHIEAHRGDPDRFWDEKNLQTVSKVWHDSVKQSMERQG